MHAGADRSGLVDCSIKINARIWDGDADQTATFSADKLVLSGARLRQLKHEIEDWLGSPHVSTVAFSGEYSLAADAYSMLDLISRHRKDIIASKDRPVVTIRLKVGRVVGEFSFVTDQSCLRLFVDDLGTAIANL